jgi:hypothetical protein
VNNLALILLAPGNVQRHLERATNIRRPRRTNPVADRLQLAERGDPRLLQDHPRIVVEHDNRELQRLRDKHFGQLRQAQHALAQVRQFHALYNKIKR